jgi:hypothetical protein
MDEQPNPPTFRWTPVFWVLAISAAGFMYHVLVFHHLEQTALLFVGIPVLLAVVLVSTPKAKTTVGSVLKATTLALLLSAPLLGEGFICIVMAAPIFYAVAMLIATLAGWLRKRPDKPRQAILPCIALIAFLPMSLEGTRPGLSFNREEQVTARRMVAASPQEIENALRHSPRIDRKLPPYLRMGFPRPTEAHGEGLEPGALRRVHFAGGEGHPGDLVLVVTQSAPGHVRFRMVSNNTKVTHWLDFKEAEVEWHAVGNQTQVTWTLRYRRLLDPAWYFGPWERYGVRLAADYLIQVNATPAGIN